MQLLARFETRNAATWRQSFDAAAESRGAAGLTVLQIWQEADSPGTAWVLFEVSDPARARSYIDTGQAALHDTEAGVTSAQWHFVKTA
ncbi:hypothetical protein [Mesobaculum littorinae]|uniref:hypothetical protein n=1 Tax=Mesobaculum littorinae TaxID=2486419 RepID=UPI0019D4856F|nr:hypothetical protein [Mesobaculum littorinae]